MATGTGGLKHTGLGGGVSPALWLVFHTALFLFYATWFLSAFLCPFPTGKGRNPCQPSLNRVPGRQRSCLGGALQVHSSHASINSQSGFLGGARQAALLLSSITLQYRNWGSRGSGGMLQLTHPMGGDILNLPPSGRGGGGWAQRWKGERMTRLQ